MAKPAHVSIHKYSLHMHCSPPCPRTTHFEVKGYGNGLEPLTSLEPHCWAKAAHVCIRSGCCMLTQLRVCRRKRAVMFLPDGQADRFCCCWLTLPLVSPFGCLCLSRLGQIQPYAFVVTTREKHNFVSCWVGSHFGDQCRKIRLETVVVTILLS